MAFENFGKMVQIAAAAVEIENGIDDDLARPVISGAPATIDFEHRAFPSENVVRLGRAS